MLSRRLYTELPWNFGLGEAAGAQFSHLAMAKVKGILRVEHMLLDSRLLQSLDDCIGSASVVSGAAPLMLTGSHQ